jgi:Ni,Fe-hydrogenase maturation factor
LGVYGFIAYRDEGVGVLIAQKLVRRFIKVSIIMPIKNPDKYQI